MASVTARQVVLSLILVASTPCASGITIDIQFVGDAVSAGFFTPERESVIQAAGTYVGSRLSDRLAAIHPVGEESFLGSTFYPGTGKGSARISSVPADTLVVFVGANDAFGASTLAVGSPGGTSASGDEVDGMIYFSHLFMTSLQSVFAIAYSSMMSFHRIGMISLSTEWFRETLVFTNR